MMPMIFIRLIPLIFLPLTPLLGVSHSPECLNHLKSVVTNAPSSDQSLLLHGTSVTTVRQIYQTGFLPSGRSSDSRINNYIYFYPNGSISNGWKAPYYFNGDLVNGVEFRKVQNGIKSYAEAIAWRHAFMDFLKFNINDDNQGSLVADFYATANFKIAKPPYFLDPTFSALLESYGVTSDGVTRAVEHANEYGGVLLTLGHSVLEDHDIQPAEGPDDGIRIHAPNGIHYRHITAIKPLMILDGFVLDQILRPSQVVEIKPD